MEQISDEENKEYKSVPSVEVDHYFPIYMTHVGDHKPTKEEVLKKVRDILAFLGSVTAAIVGANLPPASFSQPIPSLNNHEVVVEETDSHYDDMDDLFSLPTIIPLDLSRSYLAQDVHDILEDLIEKRKRLAEQEEYLHQQREKLIYEIRNGIAPSPVENDIQEFKDFLLKAVGDEKNVDAALSKIS